MKKKKYHYRQAERALNTALYHLDKLGKHRFSRHIEENKRDLKRMKRSDIHDA